MSDILIVNADSEDDVEDRLREHGYKGAFCISDCSNFEYSLWKEKSVQEI